MLYRKTLCNEHRISASTPLGESSLVESGRKRATAKKKSRKKVKRNQLTFTQIWVDRLEPSSTREVFYDLKTKHLQLEIMPTGTKVFRYRRKLDGKSQRATIGFASEITLEEARRQTEIMSAAALQGADFKLERQQKRDEITFGEVAEFWFRDLELNGARTIHDIKTDVKRWFAEELPLPLSEVSRKVVKYRVDKLAADKHYARANKALDHAKAIFNFAIQEEYTKDNPTLTIKKFKTQARDRVLQSNEFAPLKQAIESYPDDRIRDFIYLCLWTGARCGNVLAMRWEELNLDAGLWRIPLTKNGESLTIPLSEKALEILLRRKAQRQNLSPWVLPGVLTHRKCLP